MAKIHIHRSHDLGFERARAVARQWADAAAHQVDMTCTVTEGEGSDTVAFSRAGVDGRLVVDAAAFDLTARLGLLLGAFQSRIESEIEANLDTLLAKEAAMRPLPKAAARRTG